MTRTKLFAAALSLTLALPSAVAFACDSHKEQNAAAPDAKQGATPAAVAPKKKVKKVQPTTVTPPAAAPQTNNT